MFGISIKSQKSGFSLIELLVYMAILGIVLAAMYSIFVTNYKSYSSQENSVEMTQDLRAATDIMVREIRMAGYDGDLGDAFTPGFQDDADDNYDTDANSIHFTMDLNGDGDTSDLNETIQCYVSATNQLIRRSSDGAAGNVASPLAENVTALTLTFTYADGDIGINPDNTDGDDTNDHDDIRSVRISIDTETAKEDPMTGEKKTRTMTTRVRIRNAGL